MRYLFRHERKEVRGMFNRERLVLAAMQNISQLCFMMDTQSGGLYQYDAIERKKEYGDNLLRLTGKKTSSLESLHISYKEVEKLLSELSRQKTAVFRKGMELYVEIDCKDVVPGDIVFLSSGDVVPADLRVIYERDLMTEQYLFTGKKEKIKKEGALNGYSCSMSSIADIPDICLMGSRVVSGVAKAVAIGIGSATYLGKLVYGY